VTADPRTWKVQGGLDLTSPPSQRYRRPGSLIGCENYESRLEGLRRIDGYERFDGRPAPSDPLDNRDAATRLAAIEERRDAIGEVPGAGDILGVWRFKGATYAWRSDSDGNPLLYKSSPNGWAQVPLGSACPFDQATGPVGFGPGDRLSGTVGGPGNRASSTVVASVVTSGAFWETGASGVMVIDEQQQWDAGQTLSARDDDFEFKGYGARLLSTPQPIRFASPLPVESGGRAQRMRFANHNFRGQDQHETMFGIINGRGGTNVFALCRFPSGGVTLDCVFPIEPLGAGANVDDVPVDVAVHQNHLFVAYRNGSVIHSDLGNPYKFTGVGGAAELTVGEEITGMVSGYRDLLVIFGRNRTMILQGSGTADWRMTTLSDEAGCIANTAVLMDEPIVMDDRGIRTLGATDVYGDLEVATVSEVIRPLLDRIRQSGIRPVAAVRVRRKSQYRIFFDNGLCVSCGYVNRSRYRSIEFTTSTYGNYDSAGLYRQRAVTAICSVEDDDGRERIFFAMKGLARVFEMDAGTSFDGKRIRAYARFGYNDFGHPAWIKRYEKLQVECDSTYDSRIALAADFNDAQTSGGAATESLVRGTGATWDESRWSGLEWDSAPKALAESRIGGRGRNISVVAYSDQTVEPPHVIQSVTVLARPLSLRR